MTIKANPKEHDGGFWIDFQSVDINMDDFGLVLRGGDLAFVINNFADML